MITTTYTASVKARRLDLSLTAADSVVLSTRTLTGTVAWGDGSPALPITGTFPYTGALAHTYQADGFYLVQVNFANNRAPHSDTAQVLVPVEIQASDHRSASVELPGFIFGPILPRDKGFPTADQWCFHLGKDVQVIESNLRLILLTAFGERLYDPSFGTGIRRLIFEKDQRLVETVLREEVVRAVAQYEPRVTVNTIQISRTSDRDVTLMASFSPKDESTHPIELVANLTQ